MIKTTHFNVIILSCTLTVYLLSVINWGQGFETEAKAKILVSRSSAWPRGLNIYDTSTAPSYTTFSIGLLPYSVVIA